MVQEQGDRKKGKEPVTLERGWSVGNVNEKGDGIVEKEAW